MNKLAVILLAVSQFVLAADYRHVRDSSKIPSYDTTYVEGKDTFRQIYVNDGKSETYILIKNDSIVLWDVDKN